jgi:hypothetical protein
VSLGSGLKCPHHQKGIFSQALLANACNLTYAGSRDQEDLSLKPAWANSLRDPISKKKKKIHCKKGLVEWLKVRPCTKPVPLKKRRRKKKAIFKAKKTPGCSSSCL